MKVKDISKASAVVLEGQRQREIKVQSWFPITSPYYEHQARRIARIDRQIAATAERHIAHLREQMQKHTALGNALAATDYATRIAEVEAMATETVFEHNEAEQMAEPMLRLAKTEDPAITRARQMVADGQASKQMQADLATFDRHERIIEQANTEGRTVGRTIHYYRDGALANLRRAIPNDAATVRWSNEDFTERSKKAGGVLVIKREAA
jgi:hypothetical protein